MASQQAAKRIQEYLEQRHERLTLYVVQPVFREARRLLPRSTDNPHGEDALRYKLSRFDALNAQFPRVQFSVLVIDDGCDGLGNPNLVSSVVARNLIAGYQTKHPESRVQTEVLLLNDLIRQSSDLDWNPRMTSADDSRKGGSILAGFAYARQLARHQQSGSLERSSLFVDYDADLSIHPDQIMLLADKVLLEEYVAAVASRRCEGVICYIDPERDNRGQAYIREWQPMLPALAAQITDVNRGLKVYSPGAVETILTEVDDRTFPFQVECLAALTHKARSQIAEVPVSYIDSVVLSTQVGQAAAQDYQDQMDRIRRMAARYSQNL